MRNFIVLLLFAIGIVGCTPAGPAAGIVSTPNASEGTVVGQLISDTPGTSLAGMVLYLGTVLPLTPGPDHLVNLDLTNSPKTVITEDGRFVAEHIPPGQYVLVLWTPHDSRYVTDPINREQDFVITVVGGKVVDVGQLPAPSLP